MAPKHTSEEVLTSIGKTDVDATQGCKDLKEQTNLFASTLTKFGELSKQMWEQFENHFDEEYELVHETTPCRIPAATLTSNNKTLQSHPIKVENGENTFEITFSTEGYDKEEVKVSTAGQILKIEGKHEEAAGNEGQKYLSKQISRCYKVPKNCQMEKMTSRYLDNSHLVVSIPKDNSGSTSQRKIDNICQEKTSKDMAGNRDREDKSHNTIHRKRHPLFGSTTFRPCISHPIQLLPCPYSNFDESRKREPSQLQNDSFKNDNGQIQENDEEKTIILDFKDYKPEELKVTTSNGVLKVEGEHKETDDEGKSFISKKFYRSFKLQKNYQIDRTQSHFAKSGQLTISVPNDKISPMEPTIRDVPIKQEAKLSN